LWQNLACPPIAIALGRWQAGFSLGILRRSLTLFLEKNVPAEGKSLAKAQILLCETFGNSY
jgi:hypothetical protein